MEQKDLKEYSQTKIEEDLKRIGVSEGDTLFLRVSYKAIGSIEGGPIGFLKALENVVGEDGTIIMTAFPHKHIRQLRWFYRKECYSSSNLPRPTTGVLPTLALTLPETRISKKIEFPFVVIGKHSKYLTENHTHEKYGYWLLQEAIEQYGCKCLRIGGEPFVGSTHIAFDDVLKEKGFYHIKLKYGLYLKENGKRKWYDTPNTVFCRAGFKSYVNDIVNASKLSDGYVGNGYAILTNMKKSLEKEREMFREDIRITLCDNPDCLDCRTSFSFSDETNWIYFKRQFRNLFTSKRKDAISSLVSLIYKVLFGIPVQG